MRHGLPRRRPVFLFHAGDRLRDGLRPIHTGDRLRHGFPETDCEQAEDTFEARASTQEVARGTGFHARGRLSHGLPETDCEQAEDTLLRTPSVHLPARGSLFDGLQYTCGLAGSPARSNRNRSSDRDCRALPRPIQSLECIQRGALIRTNIKWKLACHSFGASGSILFLTGMVFEVSLGGPEA